MSSVTVTAGVSPRGRHDRQLQEWQQDAYKSKRKLSEPTVCPQCRYHGGISGSDVRGGLKEGGVPC